MEVEVGQTYEVLGDETRGDFPLRRGNIVTVIKTGGEYAYESYCIVEADRDIVHSSDYNETYHSAEILNENNKRVWINRSQLRLYIKIAKKLLGKYPEVVRKIHLMERRHKEFLTKKYSTGF